LYYGVPDDCLETLSAAGAVSSPRFFVDFVLGVLYRISHADSRTVCEDHPASGETSRSVVNIYRLAMAVSRSEYTKDAYNDLSGAFGEFMKYRTADMNRCYHERDQWKQEYRKLIDAAFVRSIGRPPKGSWDQKKVLRGVVDLLRSEAAWYADVAARRLVVRYGRGIKVKPSLNDAKEFFDFVEAAINSVLG